MSEYVVQVIEYIRVDASSKDDAIQRVRDGHGHTRDMDYFAEEAI